MALIRKSTGRQYPLVGEVQIAIGADTVVNTAGATVAAKGTAVVADLLPLPPGAVVIGGEVVVETASNDTGAHTVAVGDSVNATRYLAATSIKAAARTALVPTGFRGNGEDIRLTFAAATGDATAGVVTVRVLYQIGGRAHEVQPS
jgi:hypothetical protein